MQILIRTPIELKEFLKGKAESMGITMNALILVILNDWKKREEAKTA